MGDHVHMTAHFPSLYFSFLICFSAHCFFDNPKPIWIKRIVLRSASGY